MLLLDAYGQRIHGCGMSDVEFARPTDGGGIGRPEGKSAPLRETGSVLVESRE